LLSLIVVPIFYLGVERVKEMLPRRWRGKLTPADRDKELTA
jgi:hypothetical protein